LEIKIWTL